MSRRRKCCCCPRDCSKLKDAYLLSGACRGGYFKVETVIPGFFTNENLWSVDEFSCALINTGNVPGSGGIVALSRPSSGACVWNYSYGPDASFTNPTHHDYDSTTGPPQDLCGLGQGPIESQGSYPVGGYRWTLGYELQFLCNRGIAEWRLTAKFAQLGSFIGDGGFSVTASSGNFKATGTPPPPYFTSITSSAVCDACPVVLADWVVT